MTPEVQITAVESFVAQAQGQRRGIWVKPYDQFFIQAKRWGLRYRRVNKVILVNFLSRNKWQFFCFCKC